MTSGARGSDAIRTTDHDAIRRWAEARGGRPAAVAGTGGDDDSDGGILRIDFGEKEEGLEEISWDRFFRTFEDRRLAFLHQEEIEGHESRFFKLVRRD
ncbi:hypothetical protein [Rhodocista pekingensis]|uniref:1,4-alpha-glucan branching enzyme n=1 Tax=Rhodocista pekingensis TaxID=201185 RepID=A0ABW2KYH0_9PROT